MILTQEIIARSWSGRLGELRLALREFDADMNSEGFRIQGTIMAEQIEPHNDTFVVVPPAVRYFKNGRVIPLVAALLLREQQRMQEARWQLM